MSPRLAAPHQPWLLLALGSANAVLDPYASISKATYEPFDSVALRVALTPTGPRVPGAPAKTMRVHREFLPTAALRRSVICYWTRASAGGTHRVLPDGCMDILLRRPHESASFHAHIVGAMTTSLVIDDDASAESIGVRFAPGEAFRFLALPAQEATDRLVALDVARRSEPWHAWIRSTTWSRETSGLRCARRSRPSPRS